jgi:hypothetical protein
MSSYGEMPPSTNYSGYWHLDAKTSSVGAGRDFTSTGTVNFNPGRFNTAMTTTNGSSAYMVTSPSALGSLGWDSSKPFTVSMWYKFSGGDYSNGNYPFFLSDTATSWTTIEIIHGINPPFLLFQHERVNGAGDSVNVSITALPTTTFSHLAMTYDPLGTGYIYGYLNGRQIASVATTALKGTSGTVNGGTAIGTYNWDNPRRRMAYGQFDELICENRAWSAAEMQRYYDYCRGTMGPQTGMV